MHSKLLIGLCLFVAVWITSCSSDTNYTGVHKSGYTMTKTVRDITYVVTYHTAETLAKKVIQNNGNDLSEDLDSLVEFYHNSHTFLIEISSANGNKISTENVSSLEEFKQRYFELNFELDKMIYLKAKDKIYHPSLFHYEDVTGKKNTSAITVVFTPFNDSDQDFYEAHELKLTIDDQKLKTGVNHFTFQLS